MAHIHELIDFCVGAYIIHGEKVLLIHHKKLQTWLPVGGHVELNEDTDQALFREIEEESGLKAEHLTVFSTKPELTQAKALYTPNFIDIHPIGDSHQPVGLIYFVRSTTDAIALAEEEHNQIRWFTKQELSDTAFEVRSDIQWYANQAFQKVT